MTKQDCIRLLKLDVQLAECEQELEATLAYEQAQGKRNLLLSKGLKHKYEKLVRMRTNLVRNVSNRLSRQQTYSLILEERKQDVLRAEREVEAIEQAIVGIGALAVVNNTSLPEDFGILNAALKRAKNVLMHKNRAVDNWLAKSINDMPAKRQYTKPVLELLDSIDNYDFDIKIAENTKTNESYKYPVTSAYFEPHPSELQQQPESNIIELTTEEKEERVLAEMANTKYPTIMID